MNSKVASEEPLNLAVAVQDSFFKGFVMNIEYTFVFLVLCTLVEEFKNVHLFFLVVLMK